MLRACDAGREKKRKENVNKGEKKGKNKNERRAHHLPDLHDVVLSHGADDHGFGGIPGKVRDLACVSTVNELKGSEGL